MSKLDPGVRLLAAFILALMTTACSRLDLLSIVLLVVITGAFIVQLPLRSTMIKLLTMDGFIAILLVTLPFTTPGDPWFVIGGFRASWQGARHAAEIALTANSIMLGFLVLTTKMQPAEFAKGLGKIGFPESFIQLLLLTFRYIEVLRSEYKRLRLAMRARGFRPQSNMHTWRSFGYLAGMLFIRSLDRADRVFAAMKCRGFRGHFHMTGAGGGLTQADVLFLLFFSSALTAMAAWQWS
jgi:cobalt/nickel transport system permease protein